MKIAICDDNAEDVAQICALLEEHFDKNGYMGEFEIFHSGEALLAAFEMHKYSAVFLDIYMNGINGMDTAAKLRKLDPDFALVFISCSRDYAIESFAHRACSYVCKPIERAGIENAFKQCQGIFMQNARYVEVMSNRCKIKVPFCKILYVEVYNKLTLLHTTAGSIPSTTPLDKIEKRLNHAFLRCHRSYIVNMNHVDALLAENFRMRDGSLVPLRQRGRAELRDAYADFVSDRLFRVSS